MLRDRRTLLTLAAVLVLGAVAWSYLGGAEPAAPAAQTARRQTPAEQTPGQATEEVHVRLDTLEGERGGPPEARRNLFRFGSRGAGGSGANTPAPAPAPTMPAAPVDTGPPPPPPIQLKFIGVVQRADGLKLAVLTLGEGKGPVHGKEGDIIDGRYRILKIGTESVELAYADGRGRQTIRLTGQ